MVGIIFLLSNEYFTLWIHDQLHVRNIVMFRNIFSKTTCKCEKLKSEWGWSMNYHTWVFHPGEIHLGSLGSFVLLIEHGRGESVSHLNLVSDGWMILGVVEGGVGEHFLGISCKYFNDWHVLKWNQETYFSLESQSQTLPEVLQESLSSEAWSCWTRSRCCSRTPRTQVKHMLTTNIGPFVDELSKECAKLSQCGKMWQVFVRMSCQGLMTGGYNYWVHKWCWLYRTFQNILLLLHPHSFWKLR